MTRGISFEFNVYNFTSKALNCTSGCESSKCVLSRKSEKKFVILTASNVQVTAIKINVHGKNYPGDQISVMVTRISAEPEVNAAQSFVLSCIAGGGTGVFTYKWTSTCSGGCVLNTGNQASAMLVRNAARSTDSATYTCSVSDNAGNIGSNTSSIQVTGEHYFLCAFLCN